MTLLVVILLAALCGYFTLRPLFSPLRKVPAIHWSSRFSSLWILWVRWSGNELKFLLEAHRKHGSIVLVGPQDLSVSNYQDGVRKVYDVGFPKPAPFYSMFNYYRTRNAFTSLESTEHALRRRRTAALYSKSAIMQSRHLCEVTDCILYDGLLPRLDAVVAGCDDGRIDGLDLSYRVCADYLSSFLFGHCNGTTFLSLSSETKSRSDQRDTLERWRFHYENLSCHEAFFVQEMPGLYKFLKTVGINLLPRRYVEATAFLESWMSAMADKAERAITWKRSTGLALPPKDEPVVYETARAAVTEDSPHLSEQEQRMQIASEMFDHVSASREVLGLVLGYAFWYLAQHPGAQHRIHTELQEHGIDMSSPSVYGQDTISPSRAVQLDSLPYLCAVINECLRMRPTSTPLPRITPPDREVSVAGVDGIPPNTRINSFQWFMHRDPRKWERVDAWDPERWLSRDGSDGRKHDGEDVLWPFASGPRMCLGNHWAYYCMQHVLAAACSRFVFTALPREERECWPGSPEDELPVRVALRID